MNVSPEVYNQILLINILVFAAGQNGIDVQRISNERHVQNTNGIGYENLMTRLHEKETQIDNVRIYYI